MARRTWAATPSMTRPATPSLLDAPRPWRLASKQDTRSHSCSSAIVQSAQKERTDIPIREKLGDVRGRAVTIPSVPDPEEAIPVLYVGQVMRSYYP